MGKQYYIYIASNKNDSVFYTGITNDLIRRMSEHKNKTIPGFTARYSIGKLLYFEICNDPNTAIAREKQIKDYRREKKLELILKQNPGMNDLFGKLTEE
ncbi:MAG: GIY-YIG nuclease family protein [Patescibacteria group bacterium]